jgi:glycosyltransferase involved in cell wall biosynthesis
MNIAFITPEYITEKGFDGGLSNYLHKISMGLHERGHTVYIIVSSDKNEQLKFDGVHVVKVNIQSKLLSVYKRLSRGKFYAPLLWLVQSWKLNTALKRLNKTNKIDIAQFASYTAVGIFASKHIKSISRISSYQPLWDNAYGIKSSLSSKVNTYLELLALKETVFGPSNIIADAVSKRLKKPVTVLESPLPKIISANQVVYNDSLRGKKYLLFFGSIGILKGVKEIADIIPLLLEKYPDLYFVFVGKDMGFDGHTMLEYVWKKAGDNRGRCIYLGAMKQKYLQVIVQNSYTVVLPSRVDNLPNTLTESMALGKIVIGTRGASFEQLICDGQNGFLCEVANKETLYASIEKSLALTERQKLIMESNAKGSVLRLNTGIISEKLEKLFEKVIETNDLLKP